jgi:hypothetical protein
MLRKREVSTAIGIQKQRSCTDNLFVLTRILKRLPASLSFLDVRKAYDTVWRMGMVAEKVADGKVMAGPARPSY